MTSSIVPPSRGASKPEAETWPSSCIACDRPLWWPELAQEVFYVASDFGTHESPLCGGCFYRVLKSQEAIARLHTRLRLRHEPAVGRA